MLVNPPPGVNREALSAALREVHTGVINARGAGGTAVDRYNAYIRWVGEAVRMLRRQVSAADLDRLVLTRRYWLLQSLLADVTGPIGDLVETELEERVSAFDEAQRALDDQIRRWSRPGVFVVVDTSVYITDPKKLDEIDLAQLLSVREVPIHLLVPIIVVDELDGLKRSGNSRARWRAGYTLAVFDRVFAGAANSARLRPEDFSALNVGGMPRGEITIELVFDPSRHVRLPINDDEIIDRTLAIQALAGRQVMLLTYDTGQSTRARAAGLQVVKLTEPLANDPT